MLNKKRYIYIGILFLLILSVGCQPTVAGPDFEQSEITIFLTDTPAPLNINVPCDTNALKSAISSANSTPGTDTINLEAGCVYDIDSGALADAGESGLHGITSSIILHGNGATLNILRSENHPRLRAISVMASGSLSIDDLTFTLGAIYNSYPNGPMTSGAINNYGSLTLNNVTFTGNRAVDGGAIGSTGLLTVENSTFFDSQAGDGGAINTSGIAAISGTDFTQNSASNTGGAIALTGGSLTVSDCLFENNNASGGIGVTGGAAIHNADASLTVINTVFYNNNTIFRGGAIRNRGDAIIRDSEFTDNGANTGGALTHGAGTMEITNTTFTENQSIVWGGALNIEPFAILTIDSSLFTDNTSSSGGVMNAVGSSEVTIRNSTLSGNTTTSHSYGVVITDGLMTIQYSTIANNLGLSPGLFADSGGNITIGNSIVANNSAGDCAIAGGFHAVNENIDTDGTCAGFTITDDPLLGALADNGGPTMTHALMPGSPALDTATGSCLAVDQRGLGRPAGIACDIGAYEEGALVPTATPTPTATPPFTPTPSTKTMVPMIVPVVDPGECLAGPGPQYPVVQYLAAGENLTALGQGPAGDWVIVASPYFEGVVCWVLEIALGMPIDPYDMPIDPLDLPNGDQCMPVDPYDVPLNLAGMPVDPYGALPVCPSPPIPPTPVPTATEQPQGCMWAINQDSPHTCRIPCPSGGHSSGPCP